MAVGEVKCVREVRDLNIFTDAAIESIVDRTLSRSLNGECTPEEKLDFGKFIDCFHYLQIFSLFKKSALL